MRVTALLLIFGLAGAGAFWMNPAAPGASPRGVGTQPAGGVPTQTSSKLELQVPKNLDLNPDQTATADVTVAYSQAKAAGAPAGSGQEQKQDPKKASAKKTKATVKKTTKKKGEPLKQQQNSNPDTGSGNQPTLSLKFYFDMDATKNYPACTATVTPLMAEPSLKPGDPPLIVPISIASCNPKGGSGMLFLSGYRVQGVPITLKQRRSPWLSGALAGSLIVAVLICLMGGRVVSSEGHKMKDEMTQVSWDFSTSWASNITAFGSVFSFLLGLSAFPDKPLFAPRGEYLFIAAFATALAALAPAVHRFVSKSRAENPPAVAAPEGQDKATQNAAADPAVVTVGFVGGFLAASVLTIWGTLLQCAGELLIIYELERTGTIYRPIIVVVGVCVAVTAVLLIIYCYRTILSTIAANAERTGKKPTEPRMAFRAEAANSNTIVRRAMSGRKAAVL
jgi:hypothetical protein